MNDPVLREVREIRKALSEECGHDIRRFGEMIRGWQKASGREYVSPSRKAGNHIKKDVQPSLTGSSELLMRPAPSP